VRVVPDVVAAVRRRDAEVRAALAVGLAALAVQLADAVLAGLELADEPVVGVVLLVELVVLRARVGERLAAELVVELLDARADRLLALLELVEGQLVARVPRRDLSVGSRSRACSRACAIRTASGLIGVRCAMRSPWA
jgi:hypothetical protein